MLKVLSICNASFQVRRNFSDCVAQTLKVYREKNRKKQTIFVHERKFELVHLYIQLLTPRPAYTFAQMYGCIVQGLSTGFYIL